MRPRDLSLARKANKAGAHYSLRIILEARRAGIPISLGFALIQQESDFRNYYGGDPTIFINAGTVTRANYAVYKNRRGTTLMQGVGPAQLTWWQTQDAADLLGGCWVPRHNIRVAFSTLAHNIKQHGYWAGIRVYNGSGAAASHYADQVVAKARRWHSILS